jgi:hypothetical protein
MVLSLSGGEQLLSTALLAHVWTVLLHGHEYFPYEGNLINPIGTFFFK